MALLKEDGGFSGECSKKHGKQLPSEQQNKEMKVNEKPYINEKSSNTQKWGTLHSKNLISFWITLTYDI